MIEPLRPMPTGQLLDHTFALYRKHFLLFVGIATVGPAASLIFKLIAVGFRVVPAGRGRVHLLSGFGLPLLSGWLVLLAGLAIAHAGTVRAVAAVHLDQKISIGGAYRAVRDRLGRVVGIFLFTILISVVGASLVSGVAAFLIGFVLVIAKRNAASGSVGFAVGVSAAIGIVAVFVAIYVRYALSIQACVVEDKGVRDSLRRSIDLSRGSRWRTAIIYVVFAILTWTAGYGTQYVAGKAGLLLHNRIAATTLLYAAAFVSESITGPLATIGISLLYYDERVRKEAFDLQLMPASLDTPVAPMSVPAEA